MFYFHFNTFSNLDRSTVPKFFLFLTVFEDFVTSIIIIVPDSVRGYSLFVSFVCLFLIVPDSVGGYSIFVSFVCLFVCLSVCLSHLFLSHALTQKLLPRYGQPPKPIEFEVDQAMLIRLISLMSKFCKLPIS